MVHEDVQEPFRSLPAKKDLLPNEEIIPVLQKNRKYKNIHTGKRVFILCTGPSVSKMDLKKLKGEKQSR